VILLRQSLIDVVKECSFLISQSVGVLVFSLSLVVLLRQSFIGVVKECSFLISQSVGVLVFSLRVCKLISCQKFDS